MKTWLRRGLLLAVLLAVLGFVIAASGVVPVKASGGHWRITAWLLHFAMKRSVSTHSFFVKAPPLDDERLLIRGAGHYDLGCRPCHGGIEYTPVIPRHMTPHPPHLVPLIGNWDPEELFHLVKHGVKFTGMPAWPVLHRDDEVWAVVAFMRRLPAMNAADYARLARGEPRDGANGAAGPPTLSAAARRAIGESCARCHGLDGLGRGGASPIIAGQKPGYLLAALDAYGRRARYSGMMQSAVAAIDGATMKELAGYYASLAPSRPAGAITDTGSAERGRLIVEQGISRKKVPPCAECHGPGAHRRNPYYPNLAGQHADYLISQLKLFKAGLRGGSSYAHLMEHVAPHLTEEQMRDVAIYYEQLKIDNEN